MMLRMMLASWVRILRIIRGSTKTSANRNAIKMRHACNMTTRPEREIAGPEMVLRRSTGDAEAGIRMRRRMIAPVVRPVAQMFNSNNMPLREKDSILGHSLMR